MTKKLSLHNFLLILHRVTGLGIAFFLTLVGLSGTVLTLGLPIDRVLNPDLHPANAEHRAKLDPATLAERAEAWNPHLRVAYFSIEEDQVPMMVAGKMDPATGKAFDLGFEEIILDPWTGAVLDKVPMENDWHGKDRWRRKVMPFAYSLHTSLATNTSTGWTVVGVVALLWTMDCFVAFYLTLPRAGGPFWQRWRQAWKIKWGASATRVHFDLHRAGGLWLWPLLFVFGWSSVMLGLNQVYTPVMHALFHTASDDEMIARNSLPQLLERPKLSWRDAEVAGEKAMAEQAALHHFTVERAYGMAYVREFGAYTYCVRSSLDFRGHGWDTTVLIDGNSGQMRELDLPRGQHLGNSISTLLWGIHYGDLRDWLPYRLLIAFFGIFLAVLSYTGVAIWWRKRQARWKTARLASRHP